jgi:hypothetical protein
MLTTLCRSFCAARAHLSLILLLIYMKPLPALLTYYRETAYMITVSYPIGLDAIFHG